MKNSWKKNKNFWTAALAVVVSISCLLDLWTVVYDHEQNLTEAPTSDKAVQTQVEVNVKYIFEDEKVYKKEKIKYEKGQLLDSGYMSMLPDNMKFIDEFLFYEVKGDGNDEIIRNVAKTEVKDKETQTKKSRKRMRACRRKFQRRKISQRRQSFLKMIFLKGKKDAKKHQEKLDKLNSEMKDKDKLSDKRKEKIKELEAQTALFPELR